MPMAVALGYVTEHFPPPQFPAPAADAARCVFVGLRELDAAERRRIRTSHLTAFTMSDIDRMGMAKVMERAIEIASAGQASVHVSVDIDSLDPLTAPGTGTPVRGGLTYREAHLAMELIATSGVANSLEVAEVNPNLDESTDTARIAMELIGSALGKSIL
jgi:arginase